MFILPYRKRKAQEEFRARTQELKDQLINSMTRQFDAELARSVERLREALAPYTRFVRLEQERVTGADKDTTLQPFTHQACAAILVTGLVEIFDPTHFVVFVAQQTARVRRPIVLGLVTGDFIAPHLLPLGGCPIGGTGHGQAPA